MAAHQDHCGTFIVDPFDLDASCCMDVHEPLRPHQEATAKLTIKNKEQSTVEGQINWKLADAETGDIVDDLDDSTKPFKLDAGEEQTYRLTVVPEESSVIHTQINDYDDKFLATIWYALEDVRAVDEEREHYGGEPDEQPDF